MTVQLVAVIDAAVRVAEPLADRRGYFDGTWCANCGQIIARIRHARPGRTDLLGDWVHQDTGIRDPRPCPTPKAVSS